MVPRRRAQPRLEPLALPLPAVAPFPYEDLRRENRRRGKLDPEYELLDTGAFDDDRYWIVEVALRQGRPDRRPDDDTVTNAGPDTDTLHVLPTLWFRNTWSWDLGSPRPGARRRPPRLGRRPPPAPR